MSTESVKVLTPERLKILRKAFDDANCSGLHDHAQPPPISFASELVGLILHVKTPLNMRTKISKTLSHGYSTHSYITAAFQKWVTKEKWHPPLTMTPNSPILTGVST